MPRTPDPVLAARGRLAYYSRVNSADETLVQDARRDLTAAKIERYVSELLEDAPPLKPEQTERLIALLRGAASDV